MHKCWKKLNDAADAAELQNPVAVAGNRLQRLV
jgi:hypothetical protein